ncbi:MAG: phosphotransferase family protein [Deferrisomatales bacterium]
MREAQGAIEGFLARAAGAARAEVRELRPLSGGAIQENWLLDVRFEGGACPGDLAAVLRADAPSRVPESRSRSEEFALLRAAFGAGVAVPVPLWLCRDPSVAGREFFVMRRVPGVASAHRVVRDPGLGGDRAALAERLGEELAKIHSIRPPRPDLGFLPLPEASPALDAVARFRRYLDGHRVARPALEWGLRWLERHAPPAGELVLAHHDYRTGNYRVGGAGRTAVLDWEFAGWGDPLDDLGWFCARCWRAGAVDREAGGIADREPFYRGYERGSGRRVDPTAVGYWEVMAHVRWALIAVQQAERHLSGEEPSLEMALTGHIVPELELEILRLTKGEP